MDDGNNKVIQYTTH